MINFGLVVQNTGGDKLMSRFWIDKIEPQIQHIRAYLHSVKWVMVKTFAPDPKHGDITLGHTVHFLLNKKNFYVYLVFDL